MGGTEGPSPATRAVRGGGETENGRCRPSPLHSMNKGAGTVVVRVCTSSLTIKGDGGSFIRSGETRY